jgi:hypothetical protein
MGWKYEGLFEREINPGEMDLSAYWRQEKTMIPVGRMGYRRRTMLAGERLECEIYPMFGKEDEERVRAARKNETPEKQKRLNRQRAERHITLLADTNFTERDIELTLTYKNTYQPDFKRCQKDVSNFIRKVKRYREKNNLEPLKYIYVIEGGFEKKNGFGTTKLHCHMMMNAGVNRETLEEIWEFGYANTKQLQPDEDRGLEELAKYMIKESKLHGRRFCHSRNLKKPLIKARDARCSNRMVKKIVKDIHIEARDVMEKRFPSYRFVDCKVYCSDQFDGVYIRCTMRKKKT